MKYRVNGLRYFSEEDSYLEGCLPETGRVADYNIEFTGDSPEEVKSSIMDHFLVDNDAIDIDSCGDDPSRIDIARMEDESGLLASEEELEAFKKGEMKLYYAVYTGFLEKVDTANWDN